MKVTLITSFMFVAFIAMTQVVTAQDVQIEFTNSGQ